MGMHPTPLSFVLCTSLYVLCICARGAVSIKRFLCVMWCHVCFGFSVWRVGGLFGGNARGDCRQWLDSRRQYAGGTGERCYCRLVCSIASVLFDGF